MPTADGHGATYTTREILPKEHSLKHYLRAPHYGTLCYLSPGFSACAYIILQFNSSQTRFTTRGGRIRCIERKAIVRKGYQQLDVCSRSGSALEKELQMRGRLGRGNRDGYLDRKRQNTVEVIPTFFSGSSHRRSKNTRFRDHLTSSNYQHQFDACCIFSRVANCDRFTYETTLLSDPPSIYRRARRPLALPSTK